MVMDRSERIVSEYSSHRGFRDVVYEPDGNVPPDLQRAQPAARRRRASVSLNVNQTRRGVEA
jgi:hypothetical protein